MALQTKLADELADFRHFWSIRYNKFGKGVNRLRKKGRTTRRAEIILCNWMMRRMIIALRRPLKPYNCAASNRFRVFPQPVKDGLTQIPNIDVMVTDLTMPGGDGIMLIQQARLIRSDMPAILLTGYAEQVASVPPVADGNVHVLRKPVQSERLVAQLDLFIRTAQ